MEVFSWYEIENLIEESKCPNYLNKAIRELNLEYIENANEIYYKKNNKNSINAKKLYDEWFIEFLPTDFQKQKDYWVIYKFNEKTWNYDYEMWTY